MNRLTRLLWLPLFPIFLACAHDGTVVRKEFRPLSACLSYGIEGIYNFVLRGRDGVLRSQMVTREVYSRYQPGDYFNDLQPPPTGSYAGKHGDKQVIDAPLPEPCCPPTPLPRLYYGDPGTITPLSDHRGHKPTAAVKKETVTRLAAKKSGRPATARLATTRKKATGKSSNRTATVSRPVRTAPAATARLQTRTTAAAWRSVPLIVLASNR